jgi:actin related protein 2/3 complex, subunit 1A/1B
LNHLKQLKKNNKQIILTISTTELALSPNSKDVLIYEKTSNGWKQNQILTEHSSKVMSIDWAPNTNRIVTCGAVK